MVVRELLVVLEVRELREPPGAVVAGEGPLAGVGEGVAPQLGRRREVLTAAVARVHASFLPDILIHVLLNRNLGDWILRFFVNKCHLIQIAFLKVYINIVFLLHSIKCLGRNFLLFLRPLNIYSSSQQEAFWTRCDIGVGVLVQEFSTFLRYPSRYGKPRDDIPIR